MRKKLLSILLSLAMVVTMMPAMTMTAFATEDYSITVPTEFEGWYAGYYYNHNTYEEVKDGIAGCYVSDGLGQEEWTSEMATTLINAIKWQTNDSPYSGQVSSTGTVRSTGNITQKSSTPIIAVFLCENVEMTAKTKWVILLKNAFWETKPTYTTDDIYMSGIFGQAGTDIDVVSDGDMSFWSVLNDAFSGEGEYSSEEIITDGAESPANLFKVKDITEGGVTTRKITLLSDITAGEDDIALIVQEGKNIVLDLNGKKLDRGLVNGETTTQESYGSVIVINGGFLTLSDTSNDQNGIITGGTGTEHTLGQTVHNPSGWVYVGGGVCVNYGSFAIEGGTITGNKIVTEYTSYGGGVFVDNGATLSMNGGEISNNKALSNEASTLGGGVFVNSGSTFTMKDGSISNNSGISGGGVFVNNDATFTMKNGSISNNSASYGGGVFVNSDATFTMSGGGIIGNEATLYGGGIFACLNATHTFGGTAVVRGNKMTADTVIMEESNVHLQANGDNKAQATISEEEPLNFGAEIGLTVYEGNSSSWGPGKSVEPYFKTRLTEETMKYFFMNDCAKYITNPDYQGIIYSIKKQESEYVLSGTYKVTVDATEHGTVTSDKNYYVDGETVILNIAPNNGYQLKSLKYNDGSDHEITKDVTSGKCQFNMPKANVTVTAEFEEAVKYDLKINGTQVTSAMMDNNGVIDSSKVGDVITSGTVTYTPASGEVPAKLTLNNATIESTSDRTTAIQTDSDDIVIELIGTNTVSATGGHALLFHGNATFIGSGSLNATGSQQGFYFYKDGIFSMDGKVTATSTKNYGICTCGNIYLTAGAGKVIAHGVDNNNGAITIDGYGTVEGCKSIMGSTDSGATEETATSPANFIGDDWKQSKIVDSGETAKTVVLTAYPPTEYDLWINDVRVTSAMMDNNGVIDSSKVGNVITSGTVTYTPASGETPAKLALDNATIEISEQNNSAVYVEEEDITVELIGNNTVTVIRDAGFSLCGNNAAFIGSGSLNVSCSGADAIYCNGDCTFSMSGTVTATSNDNLAIYSKKSIYITKGAGKITAHGTTSLSGAVYWRTGISGYKKAIGSADFGESDENKMTTATEDTDHFMIGEAVAKTVVLTAYQPDYLWFSATGGVVELGMNKTGDNAPDIYLEYSTDGTNWSDFVKGKVVTPITLSAKGTKVYIRNKDSADKISNWNDNQQWRFCMSGNAQASVAVGGNIMSLLDKTVTIKEFTDSNKSDSAFYQLFYGCELLSDASELQLPAGKDKVLPESCYDGMFTGCTSLKAAPALPAEKLGAYCYRDMFRNCKALETAPALSATELKEYCYRNMFSYCDVLKIAPELPAAELAAYCYADMFFGCKALETAPVLPATELAAYCYYEMLSYCTALKSAPVLPATNLVEGCYCAMFDGCTKLNHIEVGFTKWDDENDATSWWVNGVAPTGNFVCPETLDNSGHIDNVSGVPTGWTIGKANCTVTFEMNDHGSALDPINVKYGEKINKPENPTADGYTFGGWYKDEACTDAWNFGADTVTEDITLYAKWIKNDVPKKAISGNVTEGGANVPNATVELFLGTVKVAATITDENGSYIFENVENGTYNIVVTKDGGKTKTEMVTISDSSTTVNVELPTSEINSKVEHKGNEVSGAKSDISKTVAGGLDKVAEKHKPKNDGDKVTVKLTVEPKQEADVEHAEAIKTEAGNGKKVEFLDLSLMMQTNNDEPVDIGDVNDELLTIIIPFDFTNVDVTSVKIIRNHGGATSTLGDVDHKNEYGEYIEINEAAQTITLHVKKFSDYAIAYDVNEGDTYTITNSAPQTSKEQNHGYIEVSGNASSGERVTVIVHPNKGYKLEKLTYKPSGDEAKNITWTKSFIMPDNDVTVDATFKKDSWHPIIPIIPIIPIGPIVPVDKYYTVSFDMQGIGDAIDPITVQKGSKLAVQDTPVAEGYEFGGWFKEAECINAWDFDKDTVTSNMTLYAKWTKVEEPTPVEPEKVSVLLVKGTKSGDKAVKLSWNKVEGATKYVVYGNSCGKDVKKLKTTTGRTYTVKKIAGKKLTAHNVYKFYVVAYTPDGKMKSKTIHFITANTKGKYANVKSIKAKKTSLQLAVGEFGQVGATYKMYSGKKHLGKEHGSALRYISNCPEVASVSSTGKVLARQAGTATIYIQDVGGKYCKTTVTVK